MSISKSYDKKLAIFLNRSILITVDNNKPNRSKTMNARTTYGELTNRQTIAPALELASEAASKGKIPVAFDTISWDRKGRSSGEALHHAVYDLTVDGKAALICCRATEGSRYGVRTISKTYYLLRRHGRGLRVTEAPKAKAAKAAKSATNLGDAIAICEGRDKLPQKIATATGYKAVALVDGELRSIFSGETYKLGIRRAQKAADDHEGGYYWYPTLDQALQAEVPDESVFRDVPRVIVECEVQGQPLYYGNGKRASTYIKPMAVVASVLP